MGSGLLPSIEISFVFWSVRVDVETSPAVRHKQWHNIIAGRFSGEAILFSFDFFDELC